jgi:hypothetical protein
MIFPLSKIRGKEFPDSKYWYHSMVNVPVPRLSEELDGIDK